MLDTLALTIPVMIPGFLSSTYGMRDNLRNRAATLTV